MRTYAVALTRAHVDWLAGHGFPSVLVSFAYDKNRTMLDGVDMKVMLDSGAFTAWTVGKTVDVDEFAAYAVDQLAKHPDAVVVNLDVIPGKAGDPRVTDRERSKAVTESARNAELLRGHGLPVMEVYHLYEPLSVLEAILERRRPGERVAFGGLARVRGKGWSGFPTKHRFCAAGFALLRDRYGWGALPPVHGLGIAPDGAVGGGHFPWASVDCSSWGSISQFGVRVRRDGKRLRGQSDQRTSNQRLSTLYAERVLDRWKGDDARYERMWASRGVKVAA